MSTPVRQFRHYRPSQERKICTDPIAPDWAGQTVILVAGGPSLSKGQIQTAKDAWIAGEVRVMGVNDAYRALPVDALYAADPHWWEYHIDNVRSKNIDLLYCQDRETCERYGLWHIPGEPKDGFSWDPQLIHFGQNSGYQAMNLACLLGAKLLLLLGYDYCYGPDGKKHWFGSHPAQFDMNPPLEHWAGLYAVVAKELAEHDISVVNCSPVSAITVFQKKTLTEALYGAAALAR